MGDFFDSGGSSSQSSLSREQESLLGPLADFARRNLNPDDDFTKTLLERLQGSTSKQSTDLAERVWREGFMNPILNTFNYDTVPAINSQFARFGGTLSTRRTKTLADSLTNLTTQASGQFAQMLPRIMDYPLQQTLGQIQGLSGLNANRFAGYDAALRFALTPTRQAVQNPEGPGWGLLNSSIGAGGFIAGSALKE